MNKISKKKISKWASSHYPKYQKYLKSRKWQYIRSEVLKRDGFKCMQCGGKENLQVHHLSYKHLYNELGYLEELCTLCRECHDKETNKGKQLYKIYGKKKEG